MLTGHFSELGLRRVAAGTVLAISVAGCGAVAASQVPAKANDAPVKLASAPDRVARAPIRVVRAPALTTPVPGAPDCPMFPADNVWNTNIAKLPVNKHSAAWLASMDSATTYLHPDFGPNSGGYPYGIPFTIVTRKHKLVKIKFTYASESNKGPYPFGPDTPIEGGKNAGGDRHAIMVNASTCTLYELWNAHYSRRGSTAGSGAIWHLTSNVLRPALDLGRRGRPADTARAAQLRPGPGRGADR